MLARSASHEEAFTQQTVLELSAQWGEAFEGLVERIGSLFARSDARAHARAYLKGLLAPVERKNGWQLAEAAGDPTPYALQHLLGRARWQADEARDVLRQYVVDELGDDRAVLILDETGFLKKGTKSAGVQRQYSGTAGRIENCQVGVFLAYAAPRGRTFLDRALYVPQSWSDDNARREEAAVPEHVTFATKPELGRQMLVRALDAGVPCAWVTADEVYGSDSKTRRLLEARRQPFVLAVSSAQRLWVDFEQVPVADLAERLAPRAWKRLSAGDGSKGPRIYDWSLWPFRNSEDKGWRHAVLFRRSVSDPADLAYYFVFAPPRTSLREMVRVAGTRWAIEESFQTAKGEVGLDQYEVRSFHGWYRHVTLALWAHAFLTVQRADAVSRKKKPRRRARLGSALVTRDPPRARVAPASARLRG